MKRLSVVFVGLLAATLSSAGCGGSGKQDAEEPVFEDEAEPEDTGPTSVPQAELDEVQRYLDRQRKIMARCWGDALEADEVPGADDGSVTLKFVVQASGSVANIEITAQTHKSAVLEGCIMEKAQRWKMPAISKALPYSFTFGFQRL
jgi:hypothetical protein